MVERTIVAAGVEVKQPAHERPDRYQEPEEFLQRLSSIGLQHDSFAVRITKERDSAIDRAEYERGCRERDAEWQAAYCAPNGSALLGPRSPEELTVYVREANRVNGEVTRYAEKRARVSALRDAHNIAIRHAKTVRASIEPSEGWWHEQVAEVVDDVAEDIERALQRAADLIAREKGSDGDDPKGE